MIISRVRHIRTLSHIIRINEQDNNERKIILISVSFFKNWHDKSNENQIHPVFVLQMS